VKRVVWLLLLGYAIGALAVIIFDRIYEGGWRGGFAILWLSLPTTIVYFLVLAGVGYWFSLSPSFRALAFSGFLSAIYPAVFGFFPAHYYRLLFAVPIVALQLGLLVTILAISSRQKKSRV
jgi:hypothetical protein